MNTQRFLLILIAASSATYAAPVTSASCHAETTVVTVYGTSEASCFSSSPSISASSAYATFELLDAGLRARLVVVGAVESYKSGSVIDFDPDTFSSALATVVLFTPGPPRLGSIHVALDYDTSFSFDASAPGFGYGWSDPSGAGGWIDETDLITLGVPLDARLSADTGPAIICPYGFCCTHCESFDVTLSFSVYEADGITPVRLSLEPVPEPSTRALLLCSFAACAILGVARAKRRT